MPKCFAIMPITTPADAVAQYGNDPDHFLHVAQYLFKPAVENAGFSFISPAVVGSDLIQAQIIENLESADLVLCDMSLWNANVFFELGIRVALDKPVAMVRDSLTTDIPFDNVPVNCHTYDWRLEQWNVEAERPKLIKFIHSSGRQKQNALWKYFGITQRAERSDPENPEDAKLDLILSQLHNLQYSPPTRRQSRAAAWHEAQEPSDQAFMSNASLARTEGIVSNALPESVRAYIKRLIEANGGDVLAINYDPVETALVIVTRNALDSSEERPIVDYVRDAEGYSGQISFFSNDRSARIPSSQKVR